MSAPVWRRLLGWVVVLCVAAAVVFVRRWVHHAQLESTPVIVPPDVLARDVIHPPPQKIVQRMLLEAKEAVAPPQRPRLAVLTFDDGPFPVTTPLLLAQLKALDVPAVFFLIGRDAQAQPAITQRIAAAGIEIGNHTLTHPEMSQLDPAVQTAEIEGGARMIQALTGRPPEYFRPPHGNYDAATIEAARRLGETIVLWDVDPGDWRSLTAEAIATSVIASARAPAVILLHNGKLATVEALPQIVRAYRAAGFQFVTVTQLQQRLPLTSINDPIRVSVSST